jgi:hypothetical protein
MNKQMSGSMGHIALKIAPVTIGSGEPIGELEWQDCPPDVAPDTLLSYLSQQFGEPIELVLTSTETQKALAVGWFFRPPVASKWAGKADLMVIPYITLDDGSEVAMFVHQADQKAMFRNLYNEGKGDRLVEIEQPQRPYRPHDQ